MGINIEPLKPGRVLQTCLAVLIIGWLGTAMAGDKRGGVKPRVLTEPLPLDSLIGIADSLGVSAVSDLFLDSVLIVSDDLKSNGMSGSEQEMTPADAGGLLRTLWTSIGLDTTSDRGTYAGFEKPPELIDEAVTEYPRLARKKGIEGTAWVNVIVDRMGAVRDVLIHPSSGWEMLDDAAAKAAWKSRFKPAVRNGKLVAAPYRYPVNFTLVKKAGTPESWDASVNPPTPAEKPAGGRTDPEIIEGVSPVYPEIATDSGWEGTVEIQARVDETGAVSDVRVARSCGHAEMDSAAVEAAWQMTYAPAQRDNEPVAAWVGYNVDFVLQQKQEPPMKARGTLAPGDIPPEMIWEDKPEYPRRALGAQVGGAVWVQALVDSTGKVRSVMIANSSGNTDLDEAAAKAAWKCKYKPAVQDGKAVAIWVTYKVDFALQGSDHAPNSALARPASVEEYPKMIEEAKPKYPSRALQAGVQGVVWISALVSETGKVRSVKIAQSSGNKDLDRAAEEAAWRCKYKPGKQDGRPVAAWVTYSVSFSLADRAEGK